MDYSFKIRIYDNHLIEKYDSDGCINYSYFDDDWHLFSYSFDIRHKQIVDFKDKILFQNDDPIRATEVRFTDETVILASVSHSTFEKTVWAEYLEKIDAYLSTQNSGD